MEINKIIAEVSKGSKFYENEKHKDKELTEKIERILKIKDDMLKAADIAGVESEADRILEELESDRDLSQCIVHVDMDAFYASVELLLNQVFRCSQRSAPTRISQMVNSTCRSNAPPSKHLWLHYPSASYLVLAVCTSGCLTPSVSRLVGTSTSTGPQSTLWTSTLTEISCSRRTWELRPMLYSRTRVKKLRASALRGMDDQAKILQKLEEVANELEQDMQFSGWVGWTVTLKRKPDTYQVFTRVTALDRWVSKKKNLYNTGRDLIKSDFPLCMRLIGLRVTNLKELRLPDDKGIKRQTPPVDTTDRDDTHCLNEVIDVDDDDLDANLMLQNHEANVGGVDGRSHLLGLEHHTDSPEPSMSKPTFSDIPPPTPAPAPSSSDTTAPRTQTCPICSKELEMDSLGLNAHIVV